MRVITFILALVFCLGVQAEERASTIKMSVDTIIEVQPGADILFVMDDSGSMSQYQKAMIDHIDYFAEEIESISSSTGVKNLFHLGVITTTAENPYGSSPNVGGKLVNGYVTTDDKNWKETLKTNLDVGTQGNGEEKAYDSISMMFENKSNLDFRRPQTPLYFVFITDEPEQVGMTTNDILAVLYSQVPTEDHISASLFSPLTVSIECPKPFSNTGGYHISELVTILGGKEYDLCDTAKLAKATRQLGQDILSIVKDDVENVYRKSVKLFGKVDFGSVKVSFNGKELTKGDSLNGFTFNPDENLIEFGAKVDFSVAPTEQVHIEYVVK